MAKLRIFLAVTVLLGGLDAVPLRTHRSANWLLRALSERGVGVPQDLKLYNTGGLSERGVGVPQDLKLYNTGGLSERGVGVPQDLKLYNTGGLSERGVGVPQDLKLYNTGGLSERGVGVPQDLKLYNTGGRSEGRVTRDDGSGEEIELQKRGAATRVDKLRAYDQNGNKVDMSVEEACLYAHNELRKLHEGTPPLKYDHALAEASAGWAVHLAEIGGLEHTDPQGQYGENIYYKAVMADIGGPDLPPVLSPAHALFSWYSESWKPGSYEKAYDYSTAGTEQPGTGHFTQVVWKSSERVGCGVATIAEPNPTNPQFTMQKTYVVAQYTKPGNFMGEYVQNVRPMKSGASPPESAADIEPVNGCINYGPNCEMYSGFCNMMGDVCGCTCAARK